MSQSLALEQAFERALEAIPARVLHGGLAVAYSGGLDSSVLLHLAADWARRHERPLHALHVHHGLSPNADRWAQHCQQVCATLSIPCQLLRVQVNAAGLGLEQAARQARYAALYAACERQGVSALLCAHHQDDQAETVLLNLLRGSGVAGLGGMHELAVRGAGGTHLLRPLLDQPRAQLEAYARAQGLSWVEDESNQALHLRRNLVRHVLLPAIEAQYPDTAAVLARSASHLRESQALLEQLADIDLQTVARAQGAALDVAALSALPVARINNLLRHWLARQGVQAPSTAQLEQLLSQMLEAGPDRQPQCRFGPVTVLRDGATIRLGATLPPAPTQEIVLDWQGQTRLPVPAWHGTLVVTPSASDGLPGTLLADGLRLACRRGGERLCEHLQRPSRSLKNLYQEHRVAPWTRAYLPLVYAGERLLYAAGLGMDIRSVQSGPGYRLHWESALFE